MKLLLALVCSLVVTASSRAQTSAPREAPVTPTKPRMIQSLGVTKVAASTPAKPADPTKKADAAKKDAPGKIEGIEIARAKGGFLGVQIVDSSFKITFYDAKKKPVAADVVRALLRWDPKYKVGQERLVLNRSDDGKSLASPRNIRPPYLFKLTIVLLQEAAGTEDGTAAGETYVIDFKA